MHLGDEFNCVRVFIRMIDQFFDCLNVRSKLEGTLRRKRERLPYTSEKDDRFKVITKVSKATCIKQVRLVLHVTHLYQKEKEISSCVLPT